MTSGPPGAPRDRCTPLAAALRRTRMLAGLSGQDLAQAIGVSQSTISRAERGQAALSLRSPPGPTPPASTGDRRAVLLALADAAVNEVATFPRQAQQRPGNRP